MIKQSCKFEKKSEMMNFYHIKTTYISLNDILGIYKRAGSSEVLKENQKSIRIKGGMY